jgi:hypothetical protein
MKRQCKFGANCINKKHGKCRFPHDEDSSEELNQLKLDANKMN